LEFEQPIRSSKGASHVPNVGNGCVGYNGTAIKLRWKCQASHDDAGYTEWICHGEVEDEKLIEVSRGKSKEVLGPELLSNDLNCRRV
jgi:hypothetical protein